MAIKKIGLFTSGGDSPGMNACIRAVVRTSIFHGLEVIGINRGYQGMISGDFVAMDANSVSNIIQLGGTILYSSRSKDFHTKEGRKTAFENLKKAGIDALIAIGGNGTFTGAHIFSNEFGISIIGLPGTIDNDLYGTDFTIGYDTALNTAIDAIDKIRDTASSHHRLFIVEVMGRDAGFIALNTGIAGGAEGVIIPEILDDRDSFLERLKNGWSHPKTSIIAVISEGDTEGGALDLANQIRSEFPDFECRATILGHIQRGGTPTCMDRVLASRLGAAAVDALLAGKKGIMVGMINHKISYIPLEKAIKHKQELDTSLMDLINILSY
jgi:6-phosphofructokinase 1